MNKLEELINDKAVKGYHKEEEETFKEGAEFVLSLDLPVKFAVWLQYQTRFDMKNTNELKHKPVFDWWLNNVYDGK